MTIPSLLSDLEQSDKPLALLVQKMEHAKVLCMAFKKGMELKSHQTPIVTKILVISGSIEYIEGEKRIALKQFEEYNIPTQVLHAVVAKEDAVILLLQG